MHKAFFSWEEPEARFIKQRLQAQSRLEEMRYIRITDTVTGAVYDCAEMDVEDQQRWMREQVRG